MKTFDVYSHKEKEQEAIKRDFRGLDSSWALFGPSYRGFPESDS